MPDRNMRSFILSLKNRSKFHFDGIARSVSDRTLRADCNDQIVVHLRRALFNCTDNILSNVTRQPFVDSRHLWPKTLKLVDRHRPNLEKRTGKKVLYTLLSRSKLLTHRTRTGCVTDRTLCKKLEEGASGSGNGGTEWRHHLF